MPRASSRTMPRQRQCQDLFNLKENSETFLLFHEVCVHCHIHAAAFIYTNAVKLIQPMSKHSCQSIHAFKFMAPHLRSSIHAFAYTLHLCSCIHATALMLTLPHCHTFSQLSRCRVADSFVQLLLRLSIFTVAFTRGASCARRHIYAAALVRQLCRTSAGSASANVDVVEHDAGGPRAGAGVGGQGGGGGVSGLFF